MNVKPKFVSAGDFENYWGEGLYNLKSNDNASGKEEIFLRRVENRLLSWIDANTFRVTAWEDLTPEQVEHLQIAILEQAMYVYRNSDLIQDSGYDPEKGKIVDYTYIESIEICEAAIREIKIAGLYNHTIRNRRRFFRF